MKTLTGVRQHMQGCTSAQARGVRQHMHASSFLRMLPPSPKGTKVNSQGCKPLEPGTTTPQNPNGVKVVWMRIPSRARVVHGTSWN